MSKLKSGINLLPTILPLDCLCDLDPKEKVKFVKVVI